MTDVDLAFGQPSNGVIQFAYTVPDLGEAMADLGGRLHVGPWFLVEHFPASEMMYRGEPTNVDFNLAITFAGHIQIEVIQQLDDTPSVYREAIDRRGHGFHHWGIASRDFEHDVREYQAMGCEVAFSCRAPVGDRLAYLDTTAVLPGMVEIIEMNAPTEEMFTEWYRATIAWDGTDPIRKVS
jgi:hypothetical protein